MYTNRNLILNQVKTCDINMSDDKSIICCNKHTQIDIDKLTKQLKKDVDKWLENQRISTTFEQTFNIIVEYLNFFTLNDIPVVSHLFDNINSFNRMEAELTKNIKNISKTPDIEDSIGVEWEKDRNDLWFALWPIGNQWACGYKITDYIIRKTIDKINALIVGCYVDKKYVREIRYDDDDGEIFLFLNIFLHVDDASVELQQKISQLEDKKNKITDEINKYKKVIKKMNQLRLQ